MSISREDMIIEAIKQTRSLGGEIWECGCFIGDWAAEVLPFVERRTFRLFDTFSGMPVSGPNDRHVVGSMMADYDMVTRRFLLWDQVHIHTGRMPASFRGLEGSTISVANLDVDNEQCVRECLPWLYEHLQPGGYLFIDDYNCGSCPGAKIATDAFMADKSEQLIVSGGPNPQAYFIKL